MIITFRDFLTEESTYKDLESQTLSFNPASLKRQNSIDPIRVNQLKIVPYIGTKSLMFNGVIKSDSGKTYDVTITFYDIQFSPADTRDTVTFKASNGKEYTINKIGSNTNNVRVRCNCSDFYYRFAWYNADDSSLHGPRPKPYVRKTTTRPPVNPDHTPGFCKHIMKVFLALRDANFFKD